MKSNSEESKSRKSNDDYFFIDSHAHLDGGDFNEDRAGVITKALDAGVRYIINIGATDGFDGADRSIVLAEQHKNIWCTAGIHPHDAKTPLDIKRLKTLLSHPKCLAVGETGLDFYRDWCPKEDQEKWFRAQIELSLELNLPLIIHSREAASECFKTLHEMEANKIGGVFHCYAENASFAEKLREINFLVSFTGVATFPKAKNIHDAVKNIPLSQMMIETDAPYMAPVPFRGKRCESAHVIETAKAIAAIKDISLEEVARVTSQNAINFYGITDV